MKLELECGELADLKMMRDELDTVPVRGGLERDRRLNLINKILDQVEQPVVEGMHQVR